MTDPVLDALMGAGGYPSAVFATVGTTVGGLVVAPAKARQVREFDAKNPGKGPLKFYPNSGDAIMGVLVDVQASPPISADDPGIRRLYAESARQKEAIRDALIAAGAGQTGIEVSGFLSMTWTGEEQGAGAVPAKTWSATYRSPAQETARSVLGAVPLANVAPPVAAAPVAYAPPVAAPVVPVAVAPVAYAPPVAVAAPVPSGLPRITAIQAAAMANAGVDISAFEIVG